MKIKTYLYHLLVLSLLFFAFSCDSDNPQKLKKVQKANKLLSGIVVLSTKAKMSSIDKTLLPQGCPAKYKFEWQEDRQKMKIELMKFQVGKMPFAVAFTAYATYSELNSWEKEEYTEKGWIKFRADDGAVYPSMPEGEDPPIADGAGIITGYVNANTEEIEFIINYNMMNVMSHCFRQKIDKNRINTYEEEFKQYEKDLKKYKEEHGL